MNNSYVITPDSDIYLLKCPLEMDSKHQLDFANATAQESYFQGLTKILMDDATYVRKDGRLYFEGSFDTLISYNYCMYKNNNYSNKWFYAFVTDMNYENNNVVSCNLTTDVFQTWMFDLTFKASFVERTHVSTNADTIGAYTYPEDLELGDYVSNNFHEVSEFQSQKLVVGTTINPYNLDQVMMGAYQNIPSGAKYYYVDLDDNGIYYMQGFLQDATDATKQDAITSLFLAPAWLCTTTDTDPTHHLKPITNTWTISSLDEPMINSVAGLDGYIPKNNKMYVYPYYYTLVTNGSGGSMILKPELWESNTHEFRIYGTITPGCSIVGMPIDYDGDAVAWTHALPLGKYPQCNYSTDQYTNWCTQNGLNNKIQMATGWLNLIQGSANLTNAIGAMAVEGNVSGYGGDVSNATSQLATGYVTIANAMQQKYLAHLAPPQFEGNTNSGDIWSSCQKITFRFNYMSIRYEYAQRIDNFFTVFGYKVNKMTVMNTTSRSNWNYIKTLECNVVGDVPESDLQRIKALYNGGFTIWHKPQYFMDYSQNNT